MTCYCGFQGKCGGCVPGKDLEATLTMRLYQATRDGYFTKEEGERLAALLYVSELDKQQRA